MQPEQLANQLRVLSGCTFYLLTLDRVNGLGRCWSRFKRNSSSVGPAILHPFANLNDVNELYKNITRTSIAWVNLRLQLHYKLILRSDSLNYNPR